MLLAGALTVGAGPGTATAHGPCRCIEPRIAAPGDELTIPVRTLRAIWNPTDADFNVELGGFRLRNWRHNPASEAITLAESAKPTEPPLSVSVPKVPAGLYMLLVFDGSEGGTHFTWEYIWVVADEGAEPSGSPTWLLPTALGAAVLLGVALFRLRSRP